MYVTAAAPTQGRHLRHGGLASSHAAHLSGVCISTSISNLESERRPQSNSEPPEIELVGAGEDVVVGVQVKPFQWVLCRGGRCGGCGGYGAGEAILVDVESSLYCGLCVFSGPFVVLSCSG
jgi:hypothetical protein